MPTLNSVVIVEWRVDNGPPRTVQYVKAARHFIYVPDGAAMSDSMVVTDYILNQKVADQPGLLQLARQGLLTVTTVAQAKVNVPAVPPAQPAAARPTPS
jgi:hypothetical protein